MSEKMTAEQVLKDVGYDGFVKGLFNRTGDLSKDFAHVTLGIATEFHEFMNATDDVNYIEEAGDLVFYLTAALLVLDDWKGIDHAQELATCDAHYSRIKDFKPTQLLGEINEILDISKRWVGYGKEPTREASEILGHCTAIVTRILAMGPDCIHTADVVLMANVAKLLDRYNGMKFNAERAVNRDLASERSTLENASAA